MRALILLWLAALCLLWGLSLSRSVALALACGAPLMAIAAHVLVEIAVFACTIAAGLGLHLDRGRFGRVAVAAGLCQLALCAGETLLRDALVLALLAGSFVERKDHAHGA